MRPGRPTRQTCIALAQGALALASVGLALAPGADSGPGALYAQYVGSAHGPGPHSLSHHGSWSGSSAAYAGAYKYGPKVGGGVLLPYYGYGLGVPYSPYYYGSFGLGPLYLPADALFGPGPLMQNLGNFVPADDGDQVVRPRPALGKNQGPALPPAAPGLNAADPPVKKVRATNAAAKARAGKFLQAGDTQFAKQKYHQALERYREGTLAAPDLGESFFRQAFAQVAMGQYDSAVKSIQRGLRIKPDWADADFQLASLYGAQHHLSQMSHREALAQAIEQNPQDAGLHLLMGALLYFDGAQERSRLFFERAAQLGANDEHLFDGFLVPAPAGAGKADVAPGPARPGRADL